MVGFALDEDGSLHRLTTFETADSPARSRRGGWGTKNCAGTLASSQISRRWDPGRRESEKSGAWMRGISAWLIAQAAMARFFSWRSLSAALAGPASPPDAP